ncbi:MULTISPECIES: hypothetical protein [Pseudomonas]|uniref:Uncharacterized protein n=1 Tax=Pseudomonas putida TaxID=303 RepID=A0A1L7NI48_PSEPU|nr:MULTISPECIES: hypothetical protein [Pseudomonas]MCE0988541.1 hypothetical protein [Pseudomonas alloputida]QKL06265.1 hypothetical protein GEV41_07430 [Pseudomonas putida]BAW25125.1 Uncharacterized protein KF715C_ch45520 [Pseudomonas putida]BBH44840.1 hypothetical protein KU43P_13170 [Pseudomonas sp. KU43P]
MAVNSFSPKKYVDHTIVDENGYTVGHIRVKPSGVLWSPSGGKGWYGIPLEDFAAFMVNHGSKQTK